MPTTPLIRTQDSRSFRNARKLRLHDLALGFRANMVRRMPLSPDEVERYARHIVLREIGGPGQQKLKAARVLVVGAGGLGSPLALYLAAAGVGTIGVIDDDHVSLSNLQRQVLHGTSDVGRPKTESAIDALARVNPNVVVEPHPFRLTAENALDLIGSYDLVADGSDSFATRYLVADAAVLARRPLVTASLGTFDGAITTIRAHETRPDGEPNPTWRCLFPEPPPAGTVAPCAEAGVLGALAGLMGSLMAIEVVREIVGFGEGLVGRLLVVDALAMRFETMTYGWDPDNPVTGANPTIRDLSIHAKAGRAA
jgi:adenylyltransferase/sulfurtransferase